MNYALVNLQTGIVENVIVINNPSDFPAPNGYLLISNYPSFVGIQTRWDGSKFIDPNPPKVGIHTPPKISGVETI